MKDRNESGKSIAVYGKGGIGKSTITANMAAAASAQLNLKTMVVGCDPKADSIHMLVQTAEPIRTILDTIRKNGTTFSALQSCLYRGFNGIVCVESGGPAPGVGCAGKGVAVALELLKEHGFFEASTDLTIFDVLGDVVCGGFAQPMRANFAKEIYVVTSGEYMSLYQAVNISSSIYNLSQDGIDVQMAGIICNQRNVEGEREIVSRLSELIEVPIVEWVPRAKEVQLAESMGMTVIEAFPDCAQSQVYLDLANRVIQNNTLVVPKAADVPGIMNELKKVIRRSSYGQGGPEKLVG